MNSDCVEPDPSGGLPCRSGAEEWAEQFRSTQAVLYVRSCGIPSVADPALAHPLEGIMQSAYTSAPREEVRLRRHHRLGDSSTVELPTLTRSILVRIQVPQPNSPPRNISLDFAQGPAGHVSHELGLSKTYVLFEDLVPSFFRVEEVLASISNMTRLISEFGLAQTTGLRSPSSLRLAFSLAFPFTSTAS